MRNVTIYSTSVCPYCVMAKDFFAANNIQYEEKNVGLDAKARDEMVHKSGQLGVPVIDIDGQIVIGFDRITLSHLLGLN